MLYIWYFSGLVEDEYVVIMREMDGLWINYVIIKNVNEKKTSIGTEYAWIH